MQLQDKDKVKSTAPPEAHERTFLSPDWPAGIIISKNEKKTVSIAEDLSVILTKDAFEQLFGWAYSTASEISCLGSVSRDGNRFIIDQFYLLKQSGTSASTELDETAVAAFLEQLIAEGEKDQASRIKCWAHSHPNMDAFWSKTDDTTCRLLVNDYLVSIVVGSNFQTRCRIDIAAPVVVVLDNIPVLYQIPTNKIALDKYAQEVRSAVSEKLFSFPKTPGKENGVQDKFIPESYCGYCGNWHLEGDCPLADEENWPGILDDEFMF